MRSIRKEMTYPHPPELVWRALTDPAVVSTWLMESEGLDARGGCQFQFRTKPAPGFDGIIHGEVLECAPPRRLVYTWASGKQKPSVVGWTITPGAGNSHLLLEHSGFEGCRGCCCIRC